MHYLPVAITAYFFNCVSVLVDKFMLTKHIPDPLLYVFYFSLFSVVAVVVAPFIPTPTLTVFIIASSSTLLWTSGAYFMFKALQIGQVSRVIPVIGTLVPLFLLIEGVISGTITQIQQIAIVLLVIGLVFLTLKSIQGAANRKEFLFIGISAFLFAISYLVLRQAYLQENFLTVLVWSRVILLPVGAIILLIPKLRHRVLAKGDTGPKLNFRSKAGALFLTGQAAGGTAELLLTFSISLASPALVNSLQGTQYVFLFFASLLLSRKYPSVFIEELGFKILLQKIIGIGAIAAGLYLLAI